MALRYRTISTVLHDLNGRQAALEYSIEAARKWGAHLSIIAAGVDVTDPGFYYAGAQAIAVQQNLEQAQNSASDVEAFVKARLRGEDIAWDVETVTLMTSGIEPFLADQMRFFDLAILPLPYGEGRSQIDVVAFEACLFGAEIPVLVVPESASVDLPKSRILVAWDDGGEALAAARASLPMLTDVAATDVCVIDPSRVASDRSDPGGRLAQLLARAGAKVEITVAAKSGPDIASQIQQRASETGAEMIVMGAYGHSRLREAVLGGVTRSMMRTAALPVFLAR